MPSLTLSAANPTTLAQNAIGATGTGSWLNTGATALSSISNALAGGYQARVASNNADIAAQEAKDYTAAGTFEAGRRQIQTAETIGAEKTTTAGNNIDVGSGTPAAIRDATQRVGDLDAAMIRYNAARSAYGANLQASNYRSQATMGALSTGFNAIGGGLKTYSSFLSGSTALENQRLLMKQTGVPGG